MQEIVKQRLYQEENYNILPVDSKSIQKNIIFENPQSIVINNQISNYEFTDNLKKNNEKFVFNITKKNHLLILKLKYK